MLEKCFKKMNSKYKKKTFWRCGGFYFDIVVDYEGRTPRLLNMDAACVWGKLREWLKWLQSWSERCPLIISERIFWKVWTLLWKSRKWSLHFSFLSCRSAKQVLFKTTSQDVLTFSSTHLLRPLHEASTGSGVHVFQRDILPLFERSRGVTLSYYCSTSSRLTNKHRHSPHFKHTVETNNYFGPFFGDRTRPSPKSFMSAGFSFRTVTPTLAAVD